MDTSREPELKSGQKNPLKEKYKYGLTSYSSQVYIKSAETFDSKIINQFNYKVYSDNDVKNRRNANSTSETESNMTKESTNKQNMFDTAKSNIQVNNNGAISAGGGTSIASVEKMGLKSNKILTLLLVKQLNIFKHIKLHLVNILIMKMQNCIPLLECGKIHFLKAVLKPKNIQ